MKNSGSRNKAPYHKGDLGEKFLEEAARVIARDGVQGISMRQLGERLGVSRMAAYHHFADKQDLLAAVGQHGFGRLSKRIEQATTRHNRSGIDSLKAALLAYLDFALEETEFFRLMFANLLERRTEAERELSPFPFSSMQARTAFQALVSAVKQSQADGTIAAGDPLLIANYLHSFVHGIACLAIDKHLKLPCSLDEFAKRSLTKLLDGLRVTAI